MIGRRDQEHLAIVKSPIKLEDLDERRPFGRYQRTQDLSVWETFCVGPESTLVQRYTSVTLLLYPNA